jgi:hypothetical protein
VLSCGWTRSIASTKNSPYSRNERHCWRSGLEQDTEIAKSTKLGPGSPEEDDDDLLVTSLELALLGIQDAAYNHEEDDDSDDDLYDLGFRFGKMRVNERVGGVFHRRWQMR